MSRRAIDDEFSHLPISRQRKYQLRMRRDGRCAQCGAPALPYASRCLKHLVQVRERMRKKLHPKRRNRNSVSYRLRRGPTRPPNTTNKAKLDRRARAKGGLGGLKTRFP